MRKLTLTREKSFVGSMGKLNVYIEDPAGELPIGGVNCRKLGQLRNGQTGEFEIGDGAARVYVVADRLSTDICCDFYKVPAGNQDVALSGKCKFNPARGNAFLFNGNEANAEAAAVRKSGTKKGWMALAFAVLGGMIIGFSVGAASCAARGRLKVVKPQTFTKNGMSIVLTNQFKEESDDDYDLVALSDKAGVFAFKEPFSVAEGLRDLSIDEYAELLIENSGIEVDKLNADGLSRWFEYDYAGDGKTMHYWVYLYKADDAFWVVNFTCPAKSAASLASSVSSWANSVSFG